MQRMGLGETVHVIDGATELAAIATHVSENQVGVHLLPPPDYLLRGPVDRWLATDVMARMTQWHLATECGRGGRIDRRTAAGREKLRGDTRDVP